MKFDLKVHPILRHNGRFEFRDRDAIAIESPISKGGVGSLAKLEKVEYRAEISCTGAEHDRTTNFRREENPPPTHPCMNLLTGPLLAVLGRASIASS